MGPLRLPYKLLCPDPIPRKGCGSTNQKPIFLTGIYRSGTSWLGRIISMADNVSYWREPFNPSVVRSMPQQYFYLAGDMDDMFYRKYTENLLKGRFVASTFDYTDKEHWFEGSGNQRCFIKDPTAAFILEWFAENYEIDTLIVIRHPAGFVSSILKLGWDFDLNCFLQQDRLMNDWLNPYRNLIEAHNYNGIDAAKGAVIWCVINFVLYQLIKRNGFNWIRYEDVCADPINQFKKIFKILNLSWNNKIKEEIQRNTASDITFSKKTNTNLERNTENMSRIWIERLTSDEINTIGALVDEFPLPFYKSLNI